MDGTHHFVLMIDADAVFHQSPDDLQMTLGGGSLERGVTSLKRNGLKLATLHSKTHTNKKQIMIAFISSSSHFFVTQTLFVI